MATRKSNPFADKVKRLPHRAYIRREGPWHPKDHAEVEAMAKRIADGAEYLQWSGSRGAELGCSIIGFDTIYKAAAMQAWIDAEKIAARPIPESPPDYPQLKVGNYNRSES
ncbi:MAG: hypothetical protein J0H44_13550 [Alphaproteobacteria bacterium]|nr:hypothetical protein [Alphaproteobacteria bacterium]